MSTAAEASLPLPCALVIEGNLAVELLVRRAITRLGPEWQVQCCRTGSSALSTLDDPQARFDLVLVDLELADMSAIDMIRSASRRLPDVPIMAVSVVAAEGAMLAAMRAGACGGYTLLEDMERPMAQALGQLLAGYAPTRPAPTRHLLDLPRRLRSRPVGKSVELSRKQLTLLKLLARGQSYAEAAMAMQIKLSTVQTHVRSLYRKLGAKSKVEAIVRARKVGLIKA